MQEAQCSGAFSTHSRPKRATFAIAARIRERVEVRRALGRMPKLAVRVAFFPTVQIDDHLHPPCQKIKHAALAYRASARREPRGRQISRPPYCSDVTLSHRDLRLSLLAETVEQAPRRSVMRSSRHIERSTSPTPIAYGQNGVGLRLEPLTIVNYKRGGNAAGAVGANRNHMSVTFRQRCHPNTLVNRGRGRRERVPIRSRRLAYSWSRRRCARICARDRAAWAH
jgi:hypothetical protein